MTYTTAPHPDRASLSMPDKRHCDTVSNSCSGPCNSTSFQSKSYQLCADPACDQCQWSQPTVISTAVGETSQMRHPSTDCRPACRLVAQSSPQLEADFTSLTTAHDWCYVSAAHHVRLPHAFAHAIQRVWGGSRHHEVLRCLNGSYGVHAADEGLVGLIVQPGNHWRHKVWPKPAHCRSKR